MAVYDKLRVSSMVWYRERWSLQPVLFGSAIDKK
jgi:hypothetical protein